MSHDIAIINQQFNQKDHSFYSTGKTASKALLPASMLIQKPEIPFASQINIIHLINDIQLLLLNQKSMIEF